MGLHSFDNYLSALSLAIGKYQSSEPVALHQDSEPIST